ncbi:MAG: A/G-specific adenine glycosylase [Alphaproteobacteria bacterium]|nr:A/G-specific adenine glycosylase [Alphaproteobacteria bacterium]MCB9690546.1 A/G-specific adenine glycosylase [Alphaproteobacteria bacterium]
MIDRAALASWYLEHARALPWRAEPTPYHVLLSELMCQQTRVETALPYFERFRARWPTVADLAAASEDEVVEAWAGLGYYSRARRLHQAARSAVARGGLPPTAAELADLPGIGPYTAGAIASIAFGEAVPAVDGNVDRVLARWHGVEEAVDSPSGKRAITAHAAALHADRAIAPGVLNQALMELGARVCKPRSPTCGTCPIRSGCTAREGDPSRFPVKRPRKAPVAITGVAGLLDRDGRTLAVRRAGTGLLGGLWGPPAVLEVDHDDLDALARAFADAGFSVRAAVPVATVRHVFSHRDLSCRVYRIEAEEAGGRGAAWSDVRWEPHGRGMSSLGRKIVAAGRADAPLLAADSRIL